MDAGHDFVDEPFLEELMIEAWQDFVITLKVDRSSYVNLVFPFLMGLDMEGGFFLTTMLFSMMRQ